jgi:tRNA 2-thiouridine synthesizing protein A
MGLKRRRAGKDAPPVETAPVSTGPVPLVTIDALGRKCPIPIIMLAERIGEVPVGQIIAVQADDVAARTDVPAWCRMKSQDFVREETLPRGWSFHIRRTY